MAGQSQPHAARYRLHRRTPWLFFHRDHPLAHERWKNAKRKREETFSDQADRLAEILALPDDEDDWPDAGEDEPAVGGGTPGLAL